MNFNKLTNKRNGETFTKGTYNGIENYVVMLMDILMLQRWQRMQENIIIYIDFYKVLK